MTWRNHETIGKVNKVWTKTPQEMLDYILMVDKENEEEEKEQEEKNEEEEEEEEENKDKDKDKDKED